MGIIGSEAGRCLQEKDRFVCKDRLRVVCLVILNNYLPKEIGRAVGMGQVFKKMPSVDEGAR